MRALLVVAVTLLGCEPFGAPNENFSRTVAGCDDAVAHLRSCCPAWDSYLSCTYLTNATASPDLTAGESRCLGKMPCAELQHAVEAGRWPCGLHPATTHCR